MSKDFLQCKNHLVASHVLNTLNGSVLVVFIRKYISYIYLHRECITDFEELELDLRCTEARTRITESGTWYHRYLEGAWLKLQENRESESWVCCWKRRSGCVSIKYRQNASCRGNVDTGNHRLWNHEHCYLSKERVLFIGLVTHLNANEKCLWPQFPSCSWSYFEEKSLSLKNIIWSLSY